MEMALEYERKSGKTGVLAGLIILYKSAVCGRVNKTTKKGAMFWNSTHIPELLQSFRKQSHSSKHMWNYQGKSSWSPAQPNIISYRTISPPYTAAIH